MNGFLVSILILVGMPALAHTIDPEATQALNVDAAAKRAVEKWNPRFTTYEMNDFPNLVKELFANRKKELPMAALGDFNGDGTTDYAFLGHDAKKTYAIFALKFPTGFRIKVAHSESYRDPRKSSVTNGVSSSQGLSLYIGLAEKQEVGMSRINTSADVLFVETFGGPNSLYQVKIDRPIKIPELFGQNGR